tara:strand:- start:158 stop:472 length:315 start_codon:yes stop_codon:yes gene_type:complete
MSDSNYVVGVYKATVDCKSSEIISKLTEMLGTFGEDLLVRVKHLMIIERFVNEYLDPKIRDDCYKNLAEHQHMDISQLVRNEGGVIIFRKKQDNYDEPWDGTPF